MRPIQLHPLSLLAGVLLAGGVGFLMSMQNITATRIQLLSSEEKEVLSHMSIVYLDDGLGNLVNKTIRVEGATTGRTPKRPRRIAVPSLASPEGEGHPQGARDVGLQGSPLLARAEHQGDVTSGWLPLRRKPSRSSRSPRS